MQLTALLAELGLNIQEAHAFSTTDGFSLDVFVVDGWPYEVVPFLFFVFLLVVLLFPSLLQCYLVVYYIYALLNRSVCWHVHSL